MKLKANEKCNNSINFDETINNLDLFSKALLMLWNEIYETSTEGNDSLYALIDSLQNITKNESKKCILSKEFNKLFSSLGNFSSMHKSSKFFNQSLNNIKPLINWYPNNVYKDADDAIKYGNYCANLVGKERECQSNPFIFHSDDILVGLFLLGANHIYPEHKHPAAEMWIVLSGNANWKRGDDDWIIRKPGEYFLHTPNQSHAMETFEEPLLALWAWTGDLDEWAKWSCENE